jgi:enoyl-CoA hydratase/carnithine racemase
VVTGKDKPSFLELTMTQDILVHTEAGVMTITFNRVDKKNSITADMYGAMADALQQAQADAAIACGGVPGPRNHLQRRQRHW